MVDDLRRKWCEDLEDLIQCPVCFERPVGPVQMCNTGHHICYSCRNLLCQCSVCKAPFSNVRNYLAEFLVNKLDEIKISLINPRHPINKFKNYEKATIGTQTEPFTKTGPKWGSASKNNSKTPEIEQTPCSCYFEECTTVTTHDKMLQHIEKCHKLNMYYATAEIAKNCMLCKYMWPIGYTVPMSVTYVLHVKKMGAFLLKIEVDELGNLKAPLTCIKDLCNNKNYRYSLVIENEVTSFKFADETQSGQLSFEKVDKYLQVPSTDMKLMTQKSNVIRINLDVSKLKTDFHRNMKPKNDPRKRTFNTSTESATPKYDFDKLLEDIGFA